MTGMWKSKQWQAGPGGADFPPSARLMTICLAMSACLLLSAGVAACNKQEDSSNTISQTAGLEAQSDPGNSDAETKPDAEAGVNVPPPVRVYSDEDLATYRKWLETDPHVIRRKLEEDGADLSTDYLVRYITMGNTNLVVRMIAGGVELNDVSSNGIHPLSEAVLQNDRYLAELMIERGANPLLRDEAPNGQGRGLLHYAAKVSNLELAQRLLEMGESIDLIDLNDQTPLDVAVFEGQVEMLRFLIDKGADPLRIDRSGSMPILRAAGAGYPAVLSLLLEHGADINFTHDRGWTPLLLALYYNHDDAAEFLLNNGADVAVRLETGFGAAGIAATLGNVKMLRRMIDAGAPLDFKMESINRNILHSCAETGLHQFIAELAAAGNDPALRDNSGISPLDIARKAGEPQTIRILEELTGELTNDNSDNEDARPESPADNSDSAGT
jgi:ankyrin repeat protein